MQIFSTTIGAQGVLGAECSQSIGPDDSAELAAAIKDTIDLAILNGGDKQEAIVVIVTSDDCGRYAFAAALGPQAPASVAIAGEHR